MADESEHFDSFRERAAGPAVLGHVSDELVQTPTARSYRLLLVEDNPADAELVRHWLQDAPKTVVHLHHVTHLQAALSALERSGYDGVVLDLGLPDSHGLDTLQRLRCLHEELPVVVLSGSHDAALRAGAVASGARDCLAKGVHGPTMVRSVLYAMERARGFRRERQFRQLIAASPDALVVSVDGVVRCVNRAAEALLGRPAPELLGRQLTFTAANGHVVELEAPGHFRRRVVAELRVSNVDWEDEAATLITLRDVTLQRELAERIRRTQRLEVVGHVVGGMAHEFNNLLTIIETLATLVHDDLRATDPKQRDVDQIVCATRSGQELVSQLVELSGWRAPAPCELDLIELARSVQRWLQHTLPPGVELRLQAPPRCLQIFADRAAVKSALVHLVAHVAAALASDGVITIALSARTLDPPTEALDGPYAVVQVYDHDTDAGSARALSQASKAASTVPASGDAQLELALCHDIVRQAGGRVVVERESQHGGCYALWFPLTRQARPAETARVGVRRRRKLKNA